MQFQIPQFTDIEDKIIGPFTLKQFLYIAGGAVFLFVLFKTLKFFIFIIVAIPVLSLVIALAFIRVHNQPFINLVKNYLGFLKKPDFYVWRKPEIQTPIEEKKIPKIIKKIPSKKRAKLKAKERLQEIGWRIEVEK